MAIEVNSLASKVSGVEAKDYQGDIIECTSGSVIAPIS